MARLGGRMTSGSAESDRITDSGGRLGSADQICVAATERFFLHRSRAVDTSDLRCLDRLRVGTRGAGSRQALILDSDLNSKRRARCRRNPAITPYCEVLINQVLGQQVMRQPLPPLARPIEKLNWLRRTLQEFTPRGRPPDFMTGTNASIISQFWRDEPA